MSRFERVKMELELQRQERQRQRDSVIQLDDDLDYVFLECTNDINRTCVINRVEVAKKDYSIIIKQ